MTHAKTSVPWGHFLANTWNAWDGAGHAATPPANDLYAPRQQFGEYEDHFLGGRLPCGPPVNSVLPLVGQPVGPSLLSRVVGPGSKGDEVAQLRQFLNGRLDPSPGLADNDFYDDATLEAVKAFQTASGLPANGKVTAKTWFRLMFGGRVARPGPRPTAKVAPTSSSRHPIAAWSVKDKFDTVLIKTAAQLPGDLRFFFGEIVDFGVRQGLAVIFTSWAGALLTNGSEGIELGQRAQMLGQIDVDDLSIMEEFNAFLTTTANASQHAHLDHAATYLAKAVTHTGVILFLTLVHRIATKHDTKREEAPAKAANKWAPLTGKEIDMRPREAGPVAETASSPIITSKKLPPEKPSPPLDTPQVVAMKKAREEGAALVEVCPLAKSAKPDEKPDSGEPQPSIKE